MLPFFVVIFQFTVISFHIVRLLLLCAFHQFGISSFFSVFVQCVCVCLCFCCIFLFLFIFSVFFPFCLHSHIIIINNVWYQKHHELKLRHVRINSIKNMPFWLNVCNPISFVYRCTRVFFLSFSLPLYWFVFSSFCFFFSKKLFSRVFT